MMVAMMAAARDQRTSTGADERSSSGCGFA
jgi:hypothetical protein